MRPHQEPWKIFQDNEAGPGWDWCISIPGHEPIMGLSEPLARRIADDHNIRLKLDRRIHNQRKANRDTWEIVEMRRNCMGSPASRASYARLVRAYRELRGVGQSPQPEKSK